MHNFVGQSQVAVSLLDAKLFYHVAGAGNDYQKDKQFKKLNAQKDLVEVKVVRNGQELLVENTDVVVGDLLLLDTGDKIVADGILIKAFGLVVDEASLTGESEPQEKGGEDIWCMSGTQVSNFLLPSLSFSLWSDVAGGCGQPLT